MRMVRGGWEGKYGGGGGGARPQAVLGLGYYVFQLSNFITNIQQNSIGCLYFFFYAGTYYFLID